MLLKQGLEFIHGVNNKGTMGRDRVHTNSDDAIPSRAVSMQDEQTRHQDHRQRTIKSLLWLHIPLPRKETTTKWQGVRQTQAFLLSVIHFCQPNLNFLKMNF